MDNTHAELAPAPGCVQVGEMLKDPEMLRRTMLAASDPSAMRAMLEQQDRMLFNILAQPGGANALKRMTREAGNGGEGGGVSDSLVAKEKMRSGQLPAQEDEAIQALARLKGQELDQALQQLPAEMRALALAARNTLLTKEMGYDRVGFKEALASNASLAMVCSLSLGIASCPFLLF